jgi:hypothetical protein
MPQRADPSRRITYASRSQFLRADVSSGSQIPFKLPGLNEYRLPRPETATSWEHPSAWFRIRAMYPNASSLDRVLPMVCAFTRTLVATWACTLGPRHRELLARYPPHGSGPGMRAVHPRPARPTVRQLRATAASPSWSGPAFSHYRQHAKHRRSPMLSAQSAGPGTTRPIGACSNALAKAMA